MNPLFGVRTRPTPLPAPAPRTDVLHNTKPNSQFYAQNGNTNSISVSAPVDIKKGMTIASHGGIDVKWIIENKPPIKIVREFYEENIKDLEDSDSF